MTSTHSTPPLCSAAALLLALAACGSPSYPAAPAAMAPSPAAAPPLVELEELGEGPKLVETAPPVKTKAREILGDVAYSLPVEANTWVEAELAFLVEERPEVIRGWLKRGEHYEEYVKRTLSSYNLPTDLYHLAMIESGFVPTARSHAGAVGMWQFMPSTGRYMGLRVDALVDERRDPVRSTHAAARHLSDLYRDLGDWALAAAAYNAGHGRITRGLASIGVDNFWDLAVWGDLAEETEHYVPRLYAVTIIGRNRARFGFPEGDSEGNGFSYDSVQVEYATPLGLLASMGDVSAGQLAALNPHLLQGTTPSGGYWVWVPPGTGRELQEAYLASAFHKQKGHGVYVVRSGDNLSMLAHRSGVPMSGIRELNPGVRWAALPIGAELTLPYNATQRLSANEPSVEVVEHVVGSGETLWGIARRYGSSVEAIRGANGIGGGVIVPGQMLRIPR